MPQAFQPVSYLELDEDYSSADENPVHVNPDDLPSAHTAYGRQDYRRFLDAGTAGDLNQTVDDGTGAGVVDTVSDGHSSNALPLVMIGLAALLLLGSQRN